jgi:hypothetical protein
VKWQEWLASRVVPRPPSRRRTGGGLDEGGWDGEGGLRLARVIVGEYPIRIFSKRFRVIRLCSREVCCTACNGIGIGQGRDAA